MKLPKEISWDIIKEQLRRQGIVLALDASPSRSGSGYVNGWRFRITVLSEDNSGILEIERITTENVVDDPFVKLLSQKVFSDTNPFCCYKCKNNKGFLMIEWWNLAKQDDRYQEIGFRMDIFDLARLRTVITT